jgi:hypothetical protein
LCVEFHGNLFVHRFDIHSKEFFTPATHSRIVQFILDRQRFSEDQNDDFAFDIEHLINESVYTAAYPLHDVSIHTVGHLFYTSDKFGWDTEHFEKTRNILKFLA